MIFIWNICMLHWHIPCYLHLRFIVFFWKLGVLFPLLPVYTKAFFKLSLNFCNYFTCQSMIPDRGGYWFIFLPGFISATYTAQTQEFMQFQGHGKLRILISKEEISIVIKYFYHMTMFPLKRNDHNNPHTIEVSTCSQYGWCQRFPYPLRFHMIANKGFNLKVLY